MSDLSAFSILTSKLSLILLVDMFCLVSVSVGMFVSIWATTVETFDIDTELCNDGGVTLIIGE